VRNQRKRIWIDRFQTYLSLRIAMYCVLYQIAVVGIVHIWEEAHGPFRELLGDWAVTFSSFGAALILAILGVLFVLDALRMAHRIVGPLYRFRKVAEAVKEGEAVALIRLRDGDYLQEMKDELNAMLEALEARGAVVLTRPGPKTKEQRPVASV
jgi:nitrogen fixation/metabolism regulation signal transduction histidine kinase